MIGRYLKNLYETQPGALNYYLDMILLLTHAAAGIIFKSNIREN